MRNRNAFTGRDDHLVNYIYDCIDRAIDIRFIVAFLMESGAKLLAKQLADAASKGIPIKILTGKYLGVTEPSATYHLYNILGKGVDIRFYDDHIRSFHPKAYLFDYKDDGEIIVGSSNISFSALTSGVEWNSRLRRSLAPTDYDLFSKTFDGLFTSHSAPVTEEVLKSYSLTWRKPRLTPPGLPQEPLDVPEPTGAQIEALFHLERAREEGVAKGLVVAATETGKTYLSAFDSQKFRRVLFVANREEILIQAAKTFAKVRPNKSIGFFTGLEKREGNVLFATVQTLGKDSHL